MDIFPKKLGNATGEQFYQTLAVLFPRVRAVVNVQVVAAVEATDPGDQVDVALHYTGLANQTN